MKKKDLMELDGKIRKNLLVIKQNLSEHLSAINENTFEIQGVFDYFQELDSKIEKLSSRLDQMQLDQGMTKEQPCVLPLNETERKIFLALYTEEKPLNCLEISEKSDVPLSIIRELLVSLTGKGIPLKRSFENNQTYYQIDPKFKEWQTKEGIINLSLNSFIENEGQTKLKTYTKIK